MRARTRYIAPVGIAVLAGCAGAPHAAAPAHVPHHAPPPLPHFGGPTNPIANGSFELGTVGWRTYPNSTLSISRRFARFGSRSVLVKVITPGSYGVFQQSVVGLPTRGSRWTLSAWVKGNQEAVGQRLVAQFNESGGAAPPATYAHVTTALQSKWTHVVARGIVHGSDRTSLDVYFIRLGNISRGEGFLVDGAELRFSPR